MSNIPTLCNPLTRAGLQFFNTPVGVIIRIDGSTELILDWWISPDGTWTTLNPSMFGDTPDVPPPDAIAVCAVCPRAREFGDGDIAKQWVCGVDDHAIEADAHKERSSVCPMVGKTLSWPAAS